MTGDRRSLLVAASAVLTVALVMVLVEVRPDVDGLRPGSSSRDATPKAFEGVQPSVTDPVVVPSEQLLPPEGASSPLPGAGLGSEAEGPNESSGEQAASVTPLDGSGGPQRTVTTVGPGSPQDRFDVRDFGAKGDGSTDDTEAVQAANDAAAAVGGGRVYFPAGTYILAGVRQDSHVEFLGSRDAVLKHADGRSRRAIIQGRIRETSGSIDTGSTVLSVRDPDGIVPGALVAIRGAGGASAIQVTELAYPVGSSLSAFAVRDDRGLRSGTNHLIIEDEIVSYSGIANGTLRDVRRGLLGTTAAAHPAGAPVAQLLRHYAVVLEVEGSKVRLDAPARLGVVEAEVSIGSLGMKLTGLTLDGSRASESVDTITFALYYALAREVVVSDCRIRSASHGAVSFDRGTRGAKLVGCELTDSGQPSTRSGATVWLFRGATGNLVRDNRIGGDANHGVVIDDRTTHASEWDGPSQNNTIERNTVEIDRVEGNVAIAISGSSLNLVAENVLKGTSQGIQVRTTHQGMRPSISAHNVVERNLLSDNHVGLFVSGTDNQLIENEIIGATKAIVDEGERNRFRGNRTSVGR